MRGQGEGPDNPGWTAMSVCGESQGAVQEGRHRPQAGAI